MQKGQKLTTDQEFALADDKQLAFFFYYLVNGWSLDELIADYGFPPEQAKRNLMTLDKIGLIELHANDRFRVLISSNIFWNKDGPLWRLFKDSFSNDFLDHPFNMANERQELCPAVLSMNSFRIILNKVDALINQVNELAEMDSALPLKNRLSLGLTICLRPWFYSELA